MSMIARFKTVIYRFVDAKVIRFSELPKHFR